MTTVRGEDLFHTGTAILTDAGSAVVAGSGVILDSTANTRGNGFQLATTEGGRVDAIAIEPASTLNDDFAILEMGIKEVTAKDAENFAVGALITGSAAGKFKEADVDDFVVGVARSATSGGSGETFFLEFWGSGFQSAAASLARAALSAAAESSDVITVTVQLQDENGDNIAEAREVELSLFDNNGLEALVGAFHLGATAGTENSTTDKPRLFVTTTAAGLATIEVTDVAGGSGATVHLRAQVYGSGGRTGDTSRLAVTFD